MQDPKLTISSNHSLTFNLHSQLKQISAPNFPKEKHFLPLDTYTYMCVLGGKKCLFSGKFRFLCFLVTTRFEIHPFALSPTIWSAVEFSILCRSIDVMTFDALNNNGIIPSAYKHIDTGSPSVISSSIDNSFHPLKNDRDDIT